MTIATICRRPIAESYAFLRLPSPILKIEPRKFVVLLLLAFQCSPSFDPRIVPLSPTAHNLLPSLVPKIGKSLFAVPPLRIFQCLPSSDS